MKKLLSMRRTGYSTRYIDACIHELFQNRQVYVDGEHRDRVLRRLDIEHLISRNDIKIIATGGGDTLIKLIKCRHCGSTLDAGGEYPTCHTCNNGSVWCIKCGRVVVNTPEGWCCIDESCR